jgi:hypothetical protein
MMFGLLALLALILAACSPVEASPSSSTWGAVITLGQAEQSDAPALWPTAERITAGWIGADETGVHQDVRILSNGNLSERVVLPLPPVHPYAQQFFPAGGENLFILWLDANPDPENRLYAAVINAKMAVERGPTLISDKLTLRYAAVSDGEGGLWTVWSGGLVSEPEIYAQYIDSNGRPRQAVLVAENADWPALARSNDGKLNLFWLSPNDGKINGATLENGAAVDIQPLNRGIMLARGDRLMGIRAAFDMTHRYLFWNVTRADGTTESWYTTAEIAAWEWRSPAHLGIKLDLEELFETRFNSGSAHATQVGASGAAWAMPLAGQFDVLPAAAQIGDQLAVIYFQQGEIAGYQNIVEVNNLIGAPALYTDRDRHLYLAWAQPTANGVADLKLTLTRQ